MEFRSDLAPPSATPVPESKAPDTPSGGGPSKFSQMLKEVEKHRARVTAAIAVALIARLLVEFNFVQLVRSPENLIVQVPLIGLAVLSYLIVLMWMAMKTRDRFGFGMALGIGVLEATYLIVTAFMLQPFNIMAVWPRFVGALAHVPMAIFAVQAAKSYPPLDSKRPWIIGFVTALVFLAIPWIAPSLLDAMKGP